MSGRWILFYLSFGLFGVYVGRSRAESGLRTTEDLKGGSLESQFASKYEDFFRVLVPSAVHVGATWDFEVAGVPFEVKGVDVDSRSNGSYFTITRHQKDVLRGMYAFLVLRGGDLTVYFVGSCFVHPLLSEYPYQYRSIFSFQLSLKELLSLSRSKYRVVTIRDFLFMYELKKGRVLNVKR